MPRVQRLHDAPHLQKYRRFTRYSDETMRLVAECISGPHFPMSLAALAEESGLSEQAVKGCMARLRYVHGVRIAMEPVPNGDRTDYCFYVADHASRLKVNAMFPRAEKHNSY